MNNELSPTQRLQFQFLLVKAADNEMNPDEQREFQRFLDTSDKCSGEWQQLQKLKEVTQDIGFKTPPDEVWDKYWENVYNRLD
jgi:hypothetical protein